MALLFMDGFDHYLAADLTKKWTEEFGACTVNSGVGVEGGNALYVPFNTHYVKKSLPSTYTTIIVGAHFSLLTGSSATNTGNCMIYGGGARKVYLQKTAANAVAVRNGANTLLGTSANGVLVENAYNFIELKAFIHETTGTVTVRVNGAEVLALTNVNTQNGGVAYADEIRLSTFIDSATIFTDNIYICDTSGTTNNDFLGEVRVKTVFPTAEGTTTGWTPLSGTNNALMVDEASPDSDTTYVYTDVVSTRDTYAMGDVATLGSTVYGVQVNIVARKEGDEVRKIKSTLKSGATHALGAEETLLTSYLFFNDIHELNPDGSVAWTEASINALEAGIDLTV